MSKRTERKMAWPLEPGVAPKINELVAGLAEEMDAVSPDSGGAILLIEMRAEDADEFLRLAERLAEAWKARDHSTLVVDAHPAEPFTGDCFEGSPEGLTEILHYGLSPEAASQHRDGCSGLWIPAGGKWNLPLESPDEPGLTLYRLAGLADRVLLLADAADSEGFLEAFRDRCHYRMTLVTPEEAEDLPPLPVGVPVVDEESGIEESEVEEAEEVEESPVPPTAPEDGSPRKLSTTPIATADYEPRRSRRWLLLLLLIPILVLAWYFLLGPGSGEEPTTLAGDVADQDSGFSHLPPPTSLPYNGVPQEEEPARNADEAEAEVEKSGDDAASGGGTPRLGQTVYNGGDSDQADTAADPAETAAGPRDADLPQDDAKREEPRPVETPVTEAKRETSPPAATAPAELRRRFESRSAWNRTLLHRGEFFVHVESYQDSILAVPTARARGFQGAGFELQPSDVRGKTYYRLLVGPFAELPMAAAYRDSLLDHTDENYCTIALGASE